jgi:hypothetical protein
MEIRQRARQLLGFSGGFLIVVLFAWTCDQIGKALLPAASEWAGSGYCLARFSEADAVETFEIAFRMNWTADGRGDIVAGMGLSRFKWDHGRTGARWSRTLAIYGTVLLTGGIFDLFSRHKARRRGLVFVGVVTSIAFASIWGRQESSYLRYMLQQNWTLSSPVTVPSLPCELPRQS